MNSIKQQYGLKYTPDTFSSIEAANRWANKCNKLHFVVMGCDLRFWVVCMADAQKLVKAGLEIIK